MPGLEFIFNNPVYVELPEGLSGWLGWLAFLLLEVLLIRCWWGQHKRWTSKQTRLSVFLFLLIPFTSLIIPGITLSSPRINQLSLFVQNPSGSILVIFAFLPAFLAGGFLGPAPAGLMAGISGLILSFWVSHNLYLPIEMAILATFFSSAMNQRYRTLFYRLIRHPALATFLLTLAYPSLYLLESLLNTRDTIANRLDFAITNMGIMTISVGGSLLFSGLLAQVVALVFPRAWGSKETLKPSPAESRLEARFFYSITPLALGLVVFLMVGNWFVAGNAARQMLQGRLANVAKIAADSVPFFLETGQNLITQQTSDPQLLSQDVNEIRNLLARHLGNFPYFSQLYVLDNQGKLITGYPLDDINQVGITPEEQRGIELALSGVLVQSYSVPPLEGAKAAQVSFLAALLNDGRVHGVLVGRSDLSTNPFAQPLINSLESMKAVDGEGMLLDEYGHILFHPNSARMMEIYTGRTSINSLYYDDNAPDGTRQLVYYQPVMGRPWAVVLTMPARYAQQQAINVATPLLGMILLFSILAIGLLRLDLRVVTSSLQGLAVEADRMAGGHLDHPLRMVGEDEVGQLGRAFEQMRTKLKARLDELNRLLLISQGVASSLEIESSLQHVLESALVTGAVSARVVLAPAIVPEMGSDKPAPTRFCDGPAGELYQYLDEQILNLSQQRDLIHLTNLSRPHILVFAPGYPRPQALLAVALRHESMFYGTFWVAYDKPHQFSEEEVRFLVTLAGQAALAAANARLFLNAEIGRQRLDAILASSPDPVLVTDHNNHLLLANPAAWPVLGLGVETGRGQPINQVISNDTLIDLLSNTTEETQSAELVLPDGRMYLATASSVFTEGRRVGRVCVLRDVTHFKEIDTLKSEIVSTVSHDLRSPLTVIRGYTTMLQMVGELNEQQSGYVRKIASSVEDMTRLVNNLLDLSRIEAGIGLQLEMVAVHDVVERVINALQPMATQKRINLSVDISQHTIPLIEVDQALLQQALHNLVENGIKYTEVGGNVQVRLAVKQEEMVFEVRDTGIGIAPADQQRLFEKFYRAAFKGARQERGSGLGLAIVKSIAERHAGKVWLESQLGKGSTFFLAIPLKQPKIFSRR